MFKFLDKVPNGVIYNNLCYVILGCIMYSSDMSYMDAFLIGLLFVVHELISAYSVTESIAKHFQMEVLELLDDINEDRKN